MPDNCLNVFFQYDGDIPWRERSLGEPFWNTSVPNKSVAAHLHGVSEGEINNRIGSGEIKLISGWMHRFKFQCVFWRDYIEFSSKRLRIYNIFLKRLCCDCCSY